MFPFSNIPIIPKLISNQAKLFERQQTTILSAAVIITAANVMSSLSGLVRQRLLIAEFFNTESSRQAFEALLVAFQVPDMMFQLIVLGALSAAFIPVFSSLKKKDEQKAFTMGAIVLNLMLLVFIGVSIVVFIFAEPLTAWRTGDAFTPEQVAVAAKLTRIMLVAQIFFAISNMFSAILQSYQRFIMPSIAPIFYNVGIVLGVYLFSDMFGIYAAGLGVCLGAFLHMAIQLPQIKKLGFKFKPSIRIDFDGVKEVLQLIPPRVLTIGISEVQNLGIGFLTTSLGNLSFVVIKLASTLITIPIRLFGVPISQASLPFLSHEATEKDLTKFRHLVLRSLNQIAFFAFPAAVLLLILRIPIVRLIFGTHNFPWTTTLSTGRAVALIAVSIGAQAMVQLLIRAFHSLKDTKTPLYITILIAVLHLGGSGLIVYFTDFGVVGIAGITSVAAFIELILFLVFLHFKIGNIITSDFWLPQFKISFASFLMAISLYLPFRILDELVFNTTRTVELIALTISTSTIGTLVYIYFATLFQVKELAMVTAIFKSFDRLKQSLPKTGELLLKPSVDDDPL
jgi:putative peptidoglycan lipid II flippase